MGGANRILVKASSLPTQGRTDSRAIGALLGYKMLSIEKVDRNANSYYAHFTQ